MYYLRKSIMAVTYGLQGPIENNYFAKIFDIAPTTSILTGYPSQQRNSNIDKKPGNINPDNSHHNGPKR